MGQDWSWFVFERQYFFIVLIFLIREIHPGLFREETYKLKLKC